MDYSPSGTLGAAHSLYPDASRISSAGSGVFYEEENYSVLKLILRNSACVALARHTLIGPLSARFNYSSSSGIP